MKTNKKTVRQLTDCGSDFRQWVTTLLLKAKLILDNSLKHMLLLDLDYEGPEVTWVYQLAENWYVQAKGMDSLDETPIQVFYESAGADILDAMINANWIDCSSRTEYQEKLNALLDAIEAMEHGR